ncbi:MAG: hypothetical protein PHG85_03580 [Candidatus Altiarchaeota archaeon]|nr:hypothetical protein [Candidatus Altiarchaeota archaeon]
MKGYITKSMAGIVIGIPAASFIISLLEKPSALDMASAVLLVIYVVMGAAYHVYWKLKKHLKKCVRE